MIFRFKQFELDQSECAMKVGTDGVLLGAWCKEMKGSALDIGTGTGLIALMLAQRNKDIMIDAVEIDQKAFKQASRNFEQSIWYDRIHCFKENILRYPNSAKYDLIVCNPPYFMNSTKASNSQRTIARHTDELSHEGLINSVKRLLNNEGVFSIILPINEGKTFQELAFKNMLFLHRVCTVYPTPIKNPKRLLMEFSLQEGSLTEESIVIEQGNRHEYSKDYITLTKDFYLNL